MERGYKKSDKPKGTTNEVGGCVNCNVGSRSNPKKCLMLIIDLFFIVYFKMSVSNTDRRQNQRS